MNHSAEFKRCLETCDVVAIRKLWQHIAPHLHQPSTDFETLATIHCARTRSEWCSFRLRAYSHSWLIDHGFPSLLPDNLKSKAERLYPRIVEGVGISINYGSNLLTVAGKMIQDEISNAVAELYADGDTDVAIVKNRIKEVREVAIRRLGVKIA